MNGWILHKKELGEIYETDKLVEEFELQGINIRIVNPQDVINSGLNLWRVGDGIL